MYVHASTATTKQDALPTRSNPHPNPKPNPDERSVAGGSEGQNPQQSDRGRDLRVRALFYPQKYSKEPAEFM